MNEVTVSSACKCLGVSTSGYYAWRKRQTNYGKIKKGEIKKPYHDGKKITYWHASYVKEVVEKNKCLE